MSAGQSGATSLRDQRMARVIDREVAPVWHDRFARMIYREMPVNPRTFVLDVHCGPGRSTAELLQRLDAGSRVLALEGDPAMVSLAKTRVKPEWKNRVYFKGGDFDDITAMAEDTYDLTVANLVLGEVVHDWKTALRELARVTKPGGQVMATVPLAGTWREVDDLFEEVLRTHGLRRELVTLHKLRRLRPQAPSIGRALEQMGFDLDDYVIEQENFQILFRSGREFLFAPVVEHGPLRLWKAVLQRTPKPQELFWQFKEAIDTYYSGHVLAVTVVAGLIRLRIPAPDLPPFAGHYWRRYPSLGHLWGILDGPLPESDSAAASSQGNGLFGAPLGDDDDDDDDDLDIDLDLEDDAEADSEIDDALENSFSDDAPRPQPRPDPAPAPTFGAGADAVDELDALDDVDSLFADAEAELNDELGLFEEEVGADVGDVIVPTGQPQPGSSPPRTVEPTVGDEYDFGDLAADDDIDDLDELDDLDDIESVEEIDENTILEALDDDDDDDLASAFGELLLPNEDGDRNKRPRQVPPPPPTGASKKLKK